MKKWLLISLFIVLVFAFLGWLLINVFPEKAIPFMLDQQLKSRAEQVEYGLDLIRDTEHITVFTVGTSSPIPGTRAQTGTAVFANGHFFMFDVGDGVVQKAENIGLPLTHLDGIFITHWHSDHMIDLPSLISRSWVLGRNTDLHLYGPDGTDTLNQAINQFLHIENQHRVDHHGTTLMDLSKARAVAHEFHNEERGRAVVFNQDGLKITAFDVSHEPVEPAVGYCIEYKGKKVVISGDTKKDDLLTEMANGADLLIHEVMLNSLLQKMSDRIKEDGQSRNAQILVDIQDYHTTPSEVAEVATEANVKKLVLHHFAPAPDLRIIKNLFKKELTGYTGPIHFANDGDRFVIETSD